jgi:hypothetical protein
MAAVLSYRGRQVTEMEVEFLRGWIAAHPQASRRVLSQQVCAAWNWVQPNGRPRDMVCRGLMLRLHRAGHLTLPPVRRVPPNPLAHRVAPAVAEIDDTTPVTGRLSALGPLVFRQVRRTDDEPQFNSLMRTHHYLGYTQPVGEQLKFLISAGTRPVAAFAWSSAPRHLGPRDRFLGWSAEARRANIRFVAYNSRFLILPWVEVPHLASHLLGRMVRMLPEEWERVYRHPVYLAETFVDRTRWRGTCYRAANWVWVGETTGRGKDDQTHRANRSRKDVLVYPLTKRFRAQLCGVE